MPNYDIFAKLSQLDVCNPTRLTRIAYWLCHCRKRAGKWCSLPLFNRKL